MKTTKVRRAAKGRECLVGLPGCDGGGETTVMAHYRLAGYCGMGQKPDDIGFGAFACYPCHELCDGRRRDRNLTCDEIRIAHAEGVMRTFAQLRQDGLL